MKPYAVQKLVAGIALRDTDEKLLDYLQFFAQHVKVEQFNFIHVLQEDAHFPALDLVNKDIMEEGRRASKKKALDQLKMAVGKYWKEHLGTTGYQVEIGDPLTELTDAGDDADADLLVIGKRTDTNQHMAFSKNIIRMADSNVLVVPKGSAKQIKVILVPIDFSENSTRALHTALTLKEALTEDVEIVALNIYQRPNLMSFELDMTPEQFEKTIIANHEEGFDSYLLKNFADKKDQIRPLLLQSDDPTAEEILEQADAVKADLIMMGAKGHSRLASLFLGSTTESLLNLNNDMPTLIVKGE
ncbi:MAG: universal stress protein [Bacteroidetes bacterium]|nr:universal stress protein [Bacteroidota bacterium]